MKDQVAEGLFDVSARNRRALAAAEITCHPLGASNARHPESERLTHTSIL